MPSCRACGNYVSETSRLCPVCRDTDPNNNVAKTIGGLALACVIGVVFVIGWIISLFDGPDEKPNQNAIETDAAAAVIQNYDDGLTQENLNQEFQISEDNRLEFERRAIDSERARLDADAAAYQAMKAADAAIARNEANQYVAPAPSYENRQKPVAGSEERNSRPNLQPASPTLIVNPEWVRRPTPPNYPEKAEMEGVAGTAVVRCEADERGALYNCSALSEYPAGFGFGLAAVGSIRRAVVRPRTVDGVPTRSSIQVNVNFDLS